MDPSEKFKMDIPNHGHGGTPPIHFVKMAELESDNIVRLQQERLEKIRNCDHELERVTETYSECKKCPYRIHHYNISIPMHHYDI